MDVFDLYAKISLDSKNYQTGIQNAKVSMDKFKVNIGDTLKTIAKISAAAVSAGATAAGKIVKDAASQYGEYQQLVGGVDALFKDSSQKIQNYANNAFSSAQISANEYMELVTSFSGAIIKSTSKGQQTDLKELKATQKQQVKDTKEQYKADYAAYKESWDKKVKAAQNAKSANLSVLKDQREQALKEYKAEQDSRLKLLEQTNEKQLKAAEDANNASKTTASSLDRAAELSNIAIQDMADQANKYGKTVQEVSQTYTSLARGNFQTLDNLFGGMFAGTKTGLQELLKTAEKYRASQGKTVKYTESSYGDIVSAIHDVNEMLGISGTSAEEASTTITGSLGSVKASWKDLLTAMGRGSGIDKSLDNFTQSVKKFGGNIKPTLETSLKSLVTVVADIAPSIAEELPKLVIEITPTLFKAGADIVGALATGIYNTLGKSNFDKTAKVLTDKVNTIIGQFDADKSGEQFSDVLNKVINAGFNIASTFDYKQAAEKLTDWSNSALKNLDVAKLGQTVSSAWKGVWDFIGTALGNIDWENIGNKISEFINNIDWNGILHSMFKAIGELIKGAPELLKGVVESLDFENAASLFAMLAAPKMAKKLLNFIKTDSDTISTLKGAGTAVGGHIGIGADGTTATNAASFIGKLSSGLQTAGLLAQAAAAGYAIGSAIYTAIEPWISDITDAIQDVMSAAEDAEANVKGNESYSRLKAAKSVAKWNEKGYNLTIDDIQYGTAAYKKAANMEELYRKFPQLEQAKISRDTLMNRTDWYEDLQKGIVPSYIQKKADENAAYSAAYSAVSRGMLGVPTSVLNQQTKIYLDTGKLVGGTGNTRAQQTNYAARGYAT